MTAHIFFMLLIMAFAVILLRLFPFLLFSGGRKIPSWMEYLGETVTAAAIAMLVVYSFYGNLEFSSDGWARFLPGTAAGALTVLLQYFIRNPLLSIVAGTFLYMFLIR
ncbi:MAG: AzlD domain-containing protein [Lentisphaeria bacterium]|nr:AzlD domain-containing protein [Lentisphaeria bacterium]